MHTRIALVVSVFYWVVLAQNTSAYAYADDDRCRDVLAKVDYAEMTTSVQKLAYVWSIQTENEFNDAKSAAANATIPIKGIPVNFGGSYDDFKKSRQQYSEQMNWNSDQSTAHSIIASFVPETAYDPWLRCMGNESGLTVSAVGITQDSLTIKVQYDHPKGLGYVPFVRIPKPTILNGDLKQADEFYKSLPKSGRIDVYTAYAHFDRINNKFFKASASLGNKTFLLIIPPEPKEKEYRSKCTVDLSEKGGVGDVHQFFSAAEDDSNNPATYWGPAVCSGFRPGARLFINVTVDFQITGGGNHVVVAPYTKSGGHGHDMKYLPTMPATSQTGKLPSSVDGEADEYGVARVWLDVGMAERDDPPFQHSKRTLLALPDSIIEITALN